MVLPFFWLIFKLRRYLQGDDFKWYETVDSWTELREKLDGLSNAIHKQEFDYVPHGEAHNMHDMSSNPQSRTYLVNPTAEPNRVHFAPAHGDPNALNIYNSPAQHAVSTGFYDPRPFGRSPPQHHQGMDEPAETIPDRQWQSGEPEPVAGPSQQSPRRRSLRENYRGQFRQHY